MNTNQDSVQTRTLIAIDEELITELRTTLEVIKLELSRLQQLETGQAPMTLKAASAYLHVSYSTLKGYLKQQEIIASEYGGRVWITRADLDAFIARNRRKVRN